MARNTSSHALNDHDRDTGDSKQQNVKRSHLSQTKVPSYSLEEALRIPQVIGDEYAFKPTTPLDVATALGVQPTTSSFRMLTGAAIAYGLTEGGYSASTISVTPLALRILRPEKKGDDIQARREAFLLPSVPREFLTRYDNHKLPREDIAKNVLASMGVRAEVTDRTLKFIINEAKQVGFLREINGAVFVSLQVAALARDSQKSITETEVEESETFETEFEEPSPFQKLHIVNGPTTQQVDNRRIFITHGKNKSFIEPLKDLLSFGELEPVVSIEHESVSQTISDKIMDDMRSCRAAIIHIEDEQKLLDAEGNQQVVLNPDVLIAIGAAMALYGKKFILLVKSDINLPPILQGLYAVRYEGSKLDGEATIRLLKAINDMKKQPLPTTSS